VLINGQPTPGFLYTCTPILDGNNYVIGFTGSGSFQVIVESPDALSARAGVASSITSGQVRWQVALGSLANGNSAGALTLADPGTGSTWNVFTRAAIQYMVPSAEIVTYNDGTGLRQILADQADVDLVTVNSTSFSINFYNPTTRQGTAFPYTHSGSPYVSYLIQQGSTATTLQITSTTLNLNTSGTARTAVTTLTRTGTNVDNFLWVLDDWNDAGLAQAKEEKRQWGGTAGNRTEALTIYKPNTGITDLVANNTFQTFNWGEQMTSTALGSGSRSRQRPQRSIR